MDRKTAAARFEYWTERLVEAERAVEYAKEQMYLSQQALGQIAVEEMMKDGTLKA